MKIRYLYLKYLEPLKRLVVVLVTACLLLETSSCLQAQNYSATPSPVAPKFSPTDQSTADFKNPTTATPIPSLTPANLLKKVCDKKKNLLVESDTSNIGGSIIYRANTTVVVIDIGTRSKRALNSIAVAPTKISIAGDMIVGPDTSNQMKIRIVSQDKEAVFLPPQGTSVYGFLDDGRILLNAGKNYSGSSEIEKFYLFSPSIGEIIPASVLLPSYNPGNDPNYTGYSPNFKYVIYPYKSKDGDKNAILNIAKGNIVVLDEYYYWYKFGLYPIWRPDSTAITITQRDSSNQYFNFYNILTDGTKIQLTKLEDVIEGGYQLFHTPTWSPNGRYLAFPINIDANNFESLFILDTQTDTIIDTCISWDYPYLGLYWSPDGNYLALNPENTSNVQIIDLENTKLYVLDTKEVSKINLIGWLSWEKP